MVQNLKSMICGRKVEIDRLLVLFLTVFIVKGIFYAAYAMPLTIGSSPDDVGHISYVMYLAIEHAIPTQNETKLEKTAFDNHLDTMRDASEGKIYNVNTKAYEESTDNNWIAQHPPLYYLYLLPFYLLTTLFTNNLSTIILVLRLATIPLGAITVFFLYRVMKLLEWGDLAVKCAMVCIVFSSAIQYYLTTINNDAMVICLSNVAFYYFVKYMKEDDVKALYIFSALCGGITISKYTGVVVLPIYALVYAWSILFVKKEGFRYFIRQSIMCMLIFAVVVTPVLALNYSRYGNPFFLVFEEEIYDYSVIYFARKSGYFNEIVSHIIHLTGGVNLLRPTGIECVIVSMIVLCAYFFKCRKNEWLRIAPFLITIIFTRITDMNTVTALIISIFLCLFLLALFDHKGKTMTLDREICVLAVFMILFYAAILFRQHYFAFLQRGRTGAMQGRYYYPLIAPFFFLLFRKLDENRDRFIGLLPLVLLLTNAGMEIELVLRGIKQW